MSMISALIDELNKSADEWNSSNMFELARMCREAADTIWQLRDDLQRTNELMDEVEHDESCAWDRVRKAEAENAKLRELVANVHEALCLDKTTLFREAIIKSLEDDMRELGIEVES